MKNDPQSDTFRRSCQHWSEEGRAGMEAFYRLASIDYQLLAEELDWVSLFQDLAHRCGPGIRLLDVACGSGQFPAALLKYAGLAARQDLSVKYSLLDPSDFSIRTARQRLVAPFEPSEEHLCTIQQFEPLASRYAVVWATHALYCVPPSELDAAVDKMLAALATEGLGYIAHASQQSHYVRFHDLYLQSLRSDDAEPFSTGEQLIEVLQAKVDMAALQCWSIDYEGTLDLEDRETAERYLQRCLFDDTLSLDRMLEDQRTGEYLRSCIDNRGGMWRFPQRVWLIFFGELAKSIDDYRRR
jgi:SAM-dependent methyltransferase